MNINLEQAKSLIRNNKVIAYIELNGIPVYTDVHEFVPFNDATFKSICLDLLHANNVLLTYSDNITYSELSTINNNDLLDNVILSDNWDDVTSLKDLKFFTGFNILKNLSDENEIFVNIEEIDMRNISSIGSYTFLNHTGISLYNTYNITTINAHAFDNAIILNNTLSFNSLTTIGLYAFYNAQFNSIIHLGNTIALSDHCFENAIFTNITFNSNNVTIGNYCFKGATIGHLTGESNITTIGNNAFENVDTTMYLHLSGLTSLGNNVFKGSNISTITSLGSITAIGEYTFNNCVNLTNLDFIPNTVLTIGIHAFDGCANIKKIGLPSSVISIASYAISNCTKLRNIKSLGSITAFTASMIDTCPNLEIVYFPDTIESWNVVAFNNCINLKIFANIKNYTYLNHCFSNCPKLDTIWLSDTLTEIKVNGILVCDNQFIKTIKLGHYLDPSTGLTITDYEITKETITVDNEELEISHYPFEQMTLLTTIDMDNNMLGTINQVYYMGKFNDIITHIPNPISLLHVSTGSSLPITSTNVYTIQFSSLKDDQYAFNYSENTRENNLHNIILDDNENVRHLKYYSYYYPSTDTSLYIKVGKYVETIEMAGAFTVTSSNTYANTITIDFSGADSLKTIQYGGMIFSGNGYLTLNIPVLPPNGEIYANACFSGISETYPLRICNDLIFTNNVKEIKEGSFSRIDCNNNSIIIPPSADVSIYYSAFSGIQNFKNLNICNYPNHHTKYIYSSFLGIGDNNGNLHFDNFYIAKTLNIGGSFSTVNNNDFTIDNLIFDNNYNIDSGTYIFAQPPVVTNLYLPDNTERYRYINCKPIHLYNVDGSINDYAKYHSITTTEIKSIEYKNNTTHINQFHGSYMLSNLEEVTIPNTVEFIGNSCFLGTSLLKEINIPENIKYIGYCTFANSNIYNINLLNIHWIGTLAFQSCNNLETITIPSSIVNYSNISDLNYNNQYGNLHGAYINATCAFMNCKNLKHVVLPNNMTTLPCGIFANCTSLSDINLDNICILQPGSLYNTAVNIDLEHTQITTIDTSALYNTVNTFRSVLKLSDTITEIGDNALSCQDNYTINEIVLPLNLHKLSKEVFANHQRLETINVNNIDYFDTSCLANTNIKKLGENTSINECILNNRPIKYFGKHVFRASNINALYCCLRKFDLSNTYNSSTYSLLNICESTNYLNSSAGYHCDINLSNSGVINIDTSAFMFNYDPRYYNYKVKLNISNQSEYISLSRNCIVNTNKRSVSEKNIYGSYNNINHIIDIDASNTRLGNIPVINSSTYINWINVPLGEHVYIDPSTDFYVDYPTSALAHTETINGEDVSVYSIDTLHFGPHMTTDYANSYSDYRLSNSRSICKCCRCIDFSQSGFTSIPSSVFGGTYGTNIYIEEVILGNKITSIPMACFQKSYKLKKVDIGTGITSIGYYSFVDSPVETVICRAITPPSVGTGHNNYRLGLYHECLTKPGGGIYVPDESVDAYKQAWQYILISGPDTLSADNYIHPLSEIEGE